MVLVEMTTLITMTGLNYHVQIDGVVFFYAYHFGYFLLKNRIKITCFCSNVNITFGFSL
jgi:hypothetical protein